jgi:ribosome biogenesis GTPase
VSLKGRLKKDRDVRKDTRATSRESMKRSRNDDMERSLKLAVGDRVTIERDDVESGWAISSIHPRSSKLARRAPGGARSERIVMVNLDQVIVVFAAAKPDPHVRMLDRFLVIAEANDLAARIVINKIDLADAAAAVKMFAEYERIGYPVHFTSAKRGDGLDSLREQVEQRVSALTGPSGVGKSSLMNTLFPGLELRTQEISESVNKGRHTTVGATLHPIPSGGFVADTPGLREVGLWGIEPTDIAHCFPEMRPLLDECRFADCTHRVEPDCEVREAVEQGTVSRDRYESYLKLREELEEGVSEPWELRP